MLAEIVDFVMIAGFCWCIFCLLEYWFPVKIKEDRFEHFGHYTVIAVNKSKRPYCNYKPADTLYNYVLSGGCEKDRPIYYQTANPRLNVGDSIYLKYKITNYEGK